MVQQTVRNRKTRTAPATQATEAAPVEKPQTAAIAKFVPADDVLSEEFNEPRAISLPYLFTIGKERDGGIFIPVEELVKAGWKDLNPEDLVQYAPTDEEIEGLWLNQLNVSILAISPTFIFSKSDENKTVIASYPPMTSFSYDRDTEGFLVVLIVMLLDENNQPLHKVPFRWNCKGTFWWTLRKTINDFYFAVETVFASLTKQKYSPKSDQWRSLASLRLTLAGRKVGEGDKSSYATYVTDYEKPTEANFSQLFFGSKGNEELVNTIWDSFGIAQSSLPPAAEAPALLAPAEDVSEDGKPLKSANPEDYADIY